jgi:small-conductance mechanosensitive channel
VAVVCALLAAPAVGQPPDAGPADASSWDGRADAPSSDGHAAVTPAEIPARGPAEGPEAPVRLRDRVVFSLRSHGKSAAVARASSAGSVLERLSEAGDAPAFRFEVHRDVAVVYGGATPILQLYTDDAAAAGDSTLSVHAASVTSKIAEAVRGERRRKAISSLVFSLSLLVFSGLIALLLVRKAIELCDRGRRWLQDHWERVPALRVASVDLVRPATVRASVGVALGLARLLAQIGIFYSWLLFALSLFDATRGYGARLTGFVLTPITALVGRIGSAIPMFLVAGLWLVAVMILLRFVRLFFASVAREETSLRLVRPDVAEATGFVTRAAIIVVALLLASPLITGSDDGSLSRAGVAALVAFALAAAPVLACVAAGIPAIFGRRLRPGDQVEVGRRAGKIRSVDLLDLKLVDELGCEVRVPHLYALFQSTRVLGRAPLEDFTISVDPGARQAEVRALLLARARRLSPAATVRLERLDGRGAHYRIVAPAAPAEDLACALADALTEQGIRLGGPGER